MCSNLLVLALKSRLVSLLLFLWWIVIFCQHCADQYIRITLLLEIPLEVQAASEGKPCYFTLCYP